eukprot:2407574-Alexandrium_andersonii.AAC.2
MEQPRSLQKVAESRRTTAESNALQLSAFFPRASPGGQSPPRTPSDKRLWRAPEALVGGVGGRLPARKGTQKTAESCRKLLPVVFCSFLRFCTGVVALVVGAQRHRIPLPSADPGTGGALRSAAPPVPASEKWGSDVVTGSEPRRGLLGPVGELGPRPPKEDLRKAI